MSNRAIDRRRAIGFFAILALVPGIATSYSALAAAGRQPVAVPQGDWILTRVVERGLGKGAKIVVTRRWQIHFARATAGMTVTGRQISATVDAPPKLAALAEIERERDASGMFPIELDQAGLIAGTAGESSQREVVKAVDAALQELRAQGDKGTSYLDHRAFLTGVTRMAAEQVSRIPADLFFPAPGTSEQDRTMPLADGETGQIALFHAATTRKDAPLLERSERRIITTIGSQQRVSSEVWSLAPAD